MNSTSLRESPVFIVGMQRSGTTLMRAILSSHPHIAIAPETHYCNYYMQTYNMEGVSEVIAFESFWSGFSESERFKDLGIDSLEVGRKIGESGDLSLKNTFRVILQEYARQQGRERWGEKTPHHYMYIQQLLTWFPDARILVMLRDPRAVCSSLLKVPWRKWGKSGIGWFESYGMKRARRICLDAARWQRHVNDLRDHWIDDSRVKLVTYESLVRNPSAVLLGICKFLEEPFAESILTDRNLSTVAGRGHKSSAHDMDEWVRDHLASSVAPITDQSVDKWQGVLQPSEIDCIQQLCASGMEWIGYEHSRSEMSCSVKLRAYASRLWYRAYLKSMRGEGLEQRYGPTVKQTD